MTAHHHIAIPVLAAPQAADRTADWYAILDARDALQAAYDLHEATVYRPLALILDQIAERPTLKFQVTDEFGRTCNFFLPANELTKFDNHPSQAVRGQADAVRERWNRYLAARSYIGYEAASDELERLCDEQGDVESELITLPAPDARAFKWKLEYLFGSERRDEGDFSPSWCAKYIDAVLADAARLLSD
jgi:hypothetical protein